MQTAISANYSRRQYCPVKFFRSSQKYSAGTGSNRISRRSL